MLPIGAYAALTAAYLAAIRGRPRTVIAGVVAYGVVLEFAQLFLPGRTTEVWDVAANIAGTAAVALLFAGRMRHPHLQD